MSADIQTENLESKLSNLKTNFQNLGSKISENYHLIADKISSIKSNHKLNPNYVIAGLGLIAALSLSGCGASQGEQIISWGPNGAQSGSYVIGLASEYCDSPNNLPSENLWYMSGNVTRQTKEGKDSEQERYSVVALQYDGKDFSCTGKWNDVESMVDSEDLVFIVPTNNSPIAQEEKSTIEGCYLTDSSGFNDGTEYPIGSLDPSNPKSSYCLGNNQWKVWSNDNQDFIKIQGGTPGGAP